MDNKSYLEKHGWINTYDNIWIDGTGRCLYQCHEVVAVAVQKMRCDRWYNKLIRKIFG